MQRRTLLKLLGGGIAALAARPFWAIADAAPSSDDYFIFIHAAGGWDVTLWSDPRNERKGIIEPASTGTVSTAGLTHWKNAKLDGETSTFEILSPRGSTLRLGPAIGGLLDLHDRLTIINGIAMNTVSHEDGTTYSATGRHRTGGVIPESSVDVVVASELGTAQLMPDVCVKFPSWFTGSRVDRRAIPLRVAEVDAITKSFARSGDFLDNDDRGAMAVALSQEASELSRRSVFPATYDQLTGQHAALPTLLDGRFTTAFSTKQLEASYPTLRIGPGGQRAAFALEAIKRNVVRCVSFGIGGLDTHNVNYRGHAHTLQDMFDVIANLVKLADETPHPTKPTAKLSEHLHILVVSEFCRTPQINLVGGRDHYPNNSALIVSPRFRAGQAFGATDPDQLLPTPFGTFVDGPRAVSPPDVLATFLAAFGIEPRRYMRDGEVLKALLV